MKPYIKRLIDEAKSRDFQEPITLLPINRTRITDSQSTIGTMAELVASTDLMNHGFEVFRALSPNASCDLVAKRGPLMLRIEVKATVMVDGLIRSRSANKRAPVDHIALVIKDGRVFYRPDLPAGEW